MSWIGVMVSWRVVLCCGERGDGVMDRQEMVSWIER